MTVHYDVEKTLQDVRERLDQVPKNPQDTPEIKAIQRNREVTISLMRMALSEANRGTSDDLVLFVLSNFVAEFVTNFARRFPASRRTEVIAHFLTHLDSCLEQTTSGETAVTSYKIRAQQGGHA